MPLPIEDYALVGDTHTAALVGRDGSVDWLCLPRFDSPACFAALLGGPEHGRWLLAPEGDVRRVERRYRPDSLVLETDFETADGTVRVVDAMPPRGAHPTLVRRVEGLRGRVPMRLELILRLDYGFIVPWIRRVDGSVLAVGGPDAVTWRGEVPVGLDGEVLAARFAVDAGATFDFCLTWHPSHQHPPQTVRVETALEETDRWWRRWAASTRHPGEWEHEAMRSLLTLKALTYAPTGGIVAAATTSLPEHLGGVRNWDYRFCWLRDATFSLYALMSAGYVREAAAWRDWLLRAVGGRPEQMQIMYGLAGERHLTELELEWLPGYRGASPVRVGNAASRQFQLDVYGEVMDSLYYSRHVGLHPDAHAWDIQKELLDWLESHWDAPDEGIWEVRGPRRHFVHSKMMAWVAMDRAVKSAERFGLDGPVTRWRALRAAIHQEVCERGFHPGRGAFVQFYGSDRLDASLLMMPMVGFLPASDPRVRGTVAAIERDLLRGGFVMRYHPDGAHEVDGLPPGEGAFLPCTFWLADNYALAGRAAEARALFERLVGLANDVGLLAEEVEPESGRFLGNFPQAFTHVALVNTAHNLSTAEGPAGRRGRI